MTLRSHPDGPGYREPDADVFTSPEPLASAELARAGGWRDSQQG